MKGSTWLFGEGMQAAQFVGLAALIGVLLPVAAPGASDRQTNYVAAPLIELNDNGAWSWFMDKRAIVDRGRLIAGSVRANGSFRDSTPPDWGNVELSILNLKDYSVRHVVLHRHLEQDDHD